MSAPLRLENAFLSGEPPMRAWNLEERPRERMKQVGARDLGDAELIALLLRTGTRGGTALALGRRIQQLANLVGGEHKLALEDLQKIPGMGLAKAASVLAAIEWGRRLRAAPAPDLKPLQTGPELFDVFRGLLGGREEEHFAVLALDARRRPVASQIISQGTLTQTLAHPREVFRAAIRMSAAGIAVGHNHPSGDCRPSPDDHTLTLRLREASQMLAIPLLDHIIVGTGVYFSYAEQGWPRV